MNLKGVGCHMSGCYPDVCDECKKNAGEYNKIIHRDNKDKKAIKEDVRLGIGEKIIGGIQGSDVWIDDDDKKQYQKNYKLKKET
jgi:hypothetical protein